MEETREHRPDETDGEAYDRTVTETHVQGVEDAAGKGRLSRKQADRMIGAGQKAHRSHDLARGMGQRGE